MPEPDISPSPPATWGSATNWFTFNSPASLFLLLNIVIGTIFISSRFTPKRKPNKEEEQEDRYRHHRFGRAPSLIDRVKSINLSFHRNSPPQAAAAEFPHHRNTPGVDHPPRETEADRSSGEASGYYSPPPVVVQRAVPLLERLKSAKLSSYRSQSVTGESEEELGYAEEAEHNHQVTRSKSEQRTTAERRGAERMRRWASEKAMTAAVEEAVDEEVEREKVERRRPATARVEKTAAFGVGDDEGVDAKADDFITKFKQQLKLQRLDSLLRYRDMFN